MGFERLVRKAAVVFVLARAASLSLAQSQVVTLVADRDNTIYSNGSNLSNGAGEHLFAGVSLHTSARRRGLLHFDVAAAVPAGSVITRVDLRMNMSQTIAGALDIELHRALADWGEGGSDATGGEGMGALATPGDATWSSRFFPATPWGAPGGDYEPAASASTLVDQDGMHTWSSTAQLVADVQSWLATPAANFGWFVINSDERTQPSAKRFDSRQNGDPQVWPRLTIEFTPPACGGATNFCLAAVNSTGVGASISFTGSTSVSANTFSLAANDLPPNATYVFIVGANAVQVPFGDGYRCIAAPLMRLGPPATASALGAASRPLDFTAPPLAGSISAGDVRHFQCWFRDPAGGPTGSQLTDALSVSYCP